MLWIVATPLGHQNDITLRALEILKSVQTVVCESTKETSKLLKVHGISGKNYELLNEHTSPEDLQSLLELCKSQDVALVSDCGTPGFHDPGFSLVHLCRKNQIPVKPIPGASSLAALISLISKKLGPFQFVGFLPQETEARQKEWKRIGSLKQDLVLMDTPYRLKKLLQEAQTHMPTHKMLLACNLTLEDEWSFEATAAEILSRLPYEKAEFMLWIYS